MWRRFLDDSGQDLIEYGLLASVIAAAGVLVFPSIRDAMEDRFGEWGDAVYGLWQPDDPAAASGS
jgi:Flp pilus assembly pilin Flp